MRTTLDCLPCLTRLALRTARQVTDDPRVLELVMRAACTRLGSLDLGAPPPLLARALFDVITATTGEPDPLAAVRERDNRLALEQLPELRRRIAAASDPLGAALRIAAAGNAIDFATLSELGAAGLTEILEQALATPFDDEVATLREALGHADDVLFLADNAGEIVLDRLLLEQLPVERITVAVRGRPTLNDALRADAVAAGLAERFEIIDNGSDVAGTVLADCSEPFVRRFRQASLVIAKGQGNYETLTGAAAHLLFVLKVKCPVVAERIGQPVGSLAVHEERNA